VGLDIGEHGNQAYPDFVSAKANYAYITKDINMENGKSTAVTTKSDRKKAV
jgi:Amt family ammonium transporter